MTTKPEDIVEEAVAAVADAQEESADAIQAAAEASSAESIAAAAAHATTAAQAAATLAETHAAQTINDNQEHIQWLRSNAEATASSLANLHSRMESTPAALQQMLQESEARTLAAVTGLLTPPQSTGSETNNETSPETESQNADAERRKADGQKQKKKRVWM